MMESVLGFIILKFIMWIFPSSKIEDVSDPEGNPAEPSPGTVRPPPATDGMGEGLPMGPHRGGRKSLAEAPKRRTEAPAP